MKQRDLELLSSYLDGQLSSSDAARLEARLRTDPEMRSVLQDLRSTRSLLRQLPMRKAPRNFTLTPQMVGKNPPLPRSYPVFRFAATLASILLFFTLGLNMLGRQMASPMPAFGMGGGGAPDTFTLESARATEPPAAAAQAPAATEAPALQAPSAGMAPQPTATALVANSDRSRQTAVAKEPETVNPAGSGPAEQPPQVLAQPQPQPAEAKVVSPVWQWLLAGIALFCLFIMALMRQLSVNRWRSKS
jgi:anti-sigma factor RsiW